MVDLVLLKWLNVGNAIRPLVAATWMISYDSSLIYLCLFSLYLLLPFGPLRRKLYHVVLAILVGVVAVGAAGVLEASLTKRPNPSVALAEQEMRLPLVRSDSSSFPCGPALVTSAIAAAMWRAPGRAQRWVFTAVAFWAAVSRTMMGFNWPSDAAESALLGWLLAKGVFWLAEPEHQSNASLDT